MITTIIIAIIIWVIFFLLHDKKEDISIIGTPLVSILLSIIVMQIASMFIPIKVKQTKHTLELHSIQDNSGISGSFYLFSGNLSDYPKYTYYYKNGENSYHIGECNANNASIVYVEETPKMEWYQDELFNKNQFLWSYVDMAPNYEPNLYRNIIFYIPNGSIANEYKLDAK